MTLSVDIFIKRAKQIHGGKYDYTKFVYTNWNTKSEIICSEHGLFVLSPRQHIERKFRCPVCTKKYKTKKSNITPEIFLERAKKIHKNKYDYSKTIFTKMIAPITITCKKHGDFTLNRAYAHIQNKNGCRQCQRDSHAMSANTFIKKASTVHNNFYVYENINYFNLNTDVEILCPIHGVQHITPTDHLRVGCWFCRRNRMQDLWLNEMNVPNTKKNRQVHLTLNNKLFIVDGFIDSTTTIYLFHGDYWHGNPTLYHPNDLNQRTGKRLGSCTV